MYVPGLSGTISPLSQQSHAPVKKSSKRNEDKGKKKKKKTWIASLLAKEEKQAGSCLSLIPFFLYFSPSSILHITTPVIPS